MINGYCVIFLLKPAMSVILNSKNLITYHNILHRTQCFKKSTSRQRSGKGTIRKRIPLQKPEVGKNQANNQVLIP